MLLALIQHKSEHPTLIKQAAEKMPELQKTNLIYGGYTLRTIAINQASQAAFLYNINYTRQSIYLVHSGSFMNMQDLQKLPRLINQKLPTSHHGWSKVVFLLGCLPFVYLFSLLFKYAINFPFWDEWVAIGSYLYRWIQGKLSFYDLWNQHNESRKFFPRLILMPLARLTNWDTRYEILLTSLCLIALSIGIHQLLKRSLPKKSLLIATLLVLINIFLCNPLQYENLLWGLQLIMFIPPMCLVGSLWLLVSSFPFWVKIFGSIFLAFFATFSFANGMILWIVLLPMVIVVSRLQSQPKPNKLYPIFVWLLSMSATLSFYFHDYVKPPYHPSLLLSFLKPLQAVQYFLSFLGAPLSFKNLFLAQILGFGLLFVFIITFTWLVNIAWLQQAENSKLTGQWWQQAVMPWLTLAAYSIGSALITAMGRVGFGVEQSLSARYVTVSIYLEVAIVASLAVLLHWRDWFTDSATRSTMTVASALEIQQFKSEKKPAFLSKNCLYSDIFYRIFRQPIVKYRRWLLVFFVTLWLVFQGASYSVGHEQLRDFNRHLRLGKACAVLLNVIRDPDCLYQWILPSVQASERVIRRMNRLHLLQPPLLTSPWVDQWGVMTQVGENYGFWDSLARGDQGRYVASGWAALPVEGRSADVVILTAADSSGHQRAIALARVAGQRADIARLLGRDFDYTGWSVALSPEQLPMEPTQLKAWAFDTLKAQAYQLPNTYLWPGRAKATATVPQERPQP